MISTRPTLRVVCLGLILAGCSPTVKLQAPDEPIRFDVNVNVTQEVRVKIDRELQDVFAENPELFGVPAPASDVNDTPALPAGVTQEKS